MRPRLLNKKSIKDYIRHKTIVRIEAAAVNMTRIFFTDGTGLEIEVEHRGHGIHGMVATKIKAKPPKSKKTFILNF